MILKKKKGNINEKGNIEGLHESQRGLLFPNTVSQVYEKLKKNRMKLCTTKCRQQV